MELRKEVKKKQGSSEDYVMNALATRLPEFDQNPNPNTDTIHFLMKLMELWKSCREPIAELMKQESNEEYKDYLELQNHIQMIDKAKVPQVLIAATPHILLNLLLISYLIFGAVFMRYVDESVRKEDFQPALLFIYTTIMTIGYGSIYPTTTQGKICCVGYCVIGIPLIFLVLSNNGQFVVDAYWILRKSAGGKVQASKSLPLWISALLFCAHSLMGGVISVKSSNRKLLFRAS
ncbi:unnamed protein product [Cylicocyclus nassatus]|uniref:Potassium channel domain-containing protein n=1 Tax=Cylicocyclus nassatus TaxID=53992 RepID=A0AA36DXB6_CYLNA|nr:unnamed protein product [Cylicocyclus nassatus]